MRASGWKFRAIGLLATILVLTGLVIGNLSLLRDLSGPDNRNLSGTVTAAPGPLLSLLPLQRSLQHLRVDLRDARLSWLSGGWAIAEGQLQETQTLLAGLRNGQWNAEVTRMLSLLHDDLQATNTLLAQTPVDLVNVDQLVLRLDQQADWLDRSVYTAVTQFGSVQQPVPANEPGSVTGALPFWLAPALVLTGFLTALYGLFVLRGQAKDERRIGVEKARALEDALEAVREEGRDYKNAARTGQGVVADLEQKLVTLRQERESLTADRDMWQHRAEDGDSQRSMYRSLADIAPGAAFYSPDGEAISVVNAACESLFDGHAPVSLADVLDEVGRDRLAAMLIDGESSLVVRDGIVPQDETGQSLILVARPLQAAPDDVVLHGFVGALLPADNPAEVLARLEQDMALVQQDEERLRGERDEAVHNLETLNREIAENRDVTEAALEEARREARVKADLLAVVSHETRTPLTGLKGVVELLLGTRLDERQARYARSASQSIDAALSLLNDMLDLSKMDADRLELSIAPFDLAHLLQEVVAILEPRAVQKGLALEIVDGPDSLWLKGDEGRLRQILLNLVGNAIKFTEHGFVRLALDLPRDGKDALAINVVDSGPGIDQAEMAGLFDAFTQTDSGLRSADAGTGLGLAISQGLALRMDGQITVDSKRGHGSVFTLNVSLDEASKSEEQAARNKARQAAPQALSGMRFKRPLKVLLAEDNDIVRMVVTEQIESMGHQVVAAETGRLVVVAARDEMPDVVLMDVNLPDMNGIDATKAIRDIAGRAGRVPIIALTANALDGDAERCLGAGMDDFLVKPVPVGLLANKLAAWGETGDMAQTPDTGKQGVVPDAVDDGAKSPVPVDVHLEIDMPDTDQAIDHDALEMLLSSLGQIRGLTLITDFIREIDTRYRNIDAAVQAGDFKTCESEAHLLKGSAGSMKAGRVFACADAIVEACRGGDRDKVPGTMPLLADVTGELTTELKARLVKTA